MDKRNFLNNTSLKYGPSEIEGFVVRPESRALVLTGLNLTALPRLNDYFDVVIVEGTAQLSMMGLTEPDIIIHDSNSLYTDGVLQYDFTAWKDTSIVLVKHGSLEQLIGLGKKSGLYQLGYLSGGEFGTEASTVRSVKAGLAENLVGVHLAAIVGASTIFDSAGREGTVLSTAESISAYLAIVDKYNNPTALISRDRQILLERM